MVPDAVPLGAGVEPGLSVTCSRLLHEVRRDAPVAVEERPRAVGQGVTQDGRGVSPLQAVALEVEGLDVR